MWWSLPFKKVADLQAGNFVKNATLTQVLSCEYCEIFKITYLEEQLRVNASEFQKSVF